jgi:branched-chain amino acid transport system substrate-binding protein
MTIPFDYKSAVADLNSKITGTDVVKIGLLTPLSLPGDVAAGTLIAQGTCLAIECLREKGLLRDNLDIELIVEDDQALAAKEGMKKSVVAGFAKLAQIDKVLAVVGQWHSRTCVEAVEISTKLDVPMFVQSGYDNFTKRGYKNIFRTYSTVEDRMFIMLDFLKEQGYQRIGCAASNTDFTRLVADDLERVNKEGNYGFDILRVNFDQETATDIKPQLQQLIDFKPDVVLNDGVVRTNYLVIQQAAELGLLPKTPMVTIFAYPTRTEDFWNEAGEAGEKLVWASLVYRPGFDGLTDIGTWFTDTFRERNGFDPPNSALLTFTHMLIAGQAASKAKELTRSALIESLESNDFDSWMGKVRFGKNGDHLHHSPAPIVLMQYGEYKQDLKDAKVVYPPEYATGSYRK